jgi:hypothetical protein
VPDGRIHKTPKGTKGQSKKAENPKRISLRQRWNKTALHNKILATAGAIAAISGTVYAITFVVDRIVDWNRYRVEHRSLVIHARPPRFLQPVTCDPDRSGGGFTYGNAESSVKNIGNDTAGHVYPFMFEMKIIPEHKTGDHFWDDLPVANCDFVPNANPMMFSLLHGEEKSVQIRQGVMGLPPLKKGDSVQLYRMECAYYTDAQEMHHAVCDLYRFYVPSDDPLDRIMGTPSFSCDGSPRIGTFQQYLTGGCRK